MRMTEEREWKKERVLGGRDIDSCITHVKIKFRERVEVDTIREVSRKYVTARYTS